MTKGNIPKDSVLYSGPVSCSHSYPGVREWKAWQSNEGWRRWAKAMPG